MRDNYKDYLERILHSKEFDNCKTEQKLLTYLFEKSIEEVELSETKIAEDIFGKDADFDPLESSIVRVHLHKVRKKLQIYYLTEGKNDLVRFELPRRTYRIQFISQKGIFQYINNLNRSNKVVVSVLVILLLIVSYLYFASKREPVKNLTVLDNTFWVDMFENDYPNHLVMGNLFFFLQVDLSDSVYHIRDKKIVRITDINSEEELMAYKEKMEDNNLEITPFSPEMFQKDLLWSFPHIAPLLNQQSGGYDLLLSSELTWSDVKNHNIIYLGITKSLGILDALLAELPIKFEYYPHKISIQRSIENVEELMPEGNSSQGSRKDYVIVAKIPGPSVNNRILIITCTDILGVLETTKLLTDEASLTDIENQLIAKHGEIPEFCEMLFEISSIERVGIKARLVESFPISAEIEYNVPNQ